MSLRDYRFSVYFGLYMPARAIVVCAASQSLALAALNAELTKEEKKKLLNCDILSIQDCAHSKGVV